MLGTLLVAAGYTADGLKERLGADTNVRVLEARLTDTSPLNTLIRLFFVGTSLSWQDAAKALLSFLSSEAAQATWKAKGFDAP